MKALELSREIMYREIVVGRSAVKAIGLFVFIALTTLGAYVRIPLPFTPVPITLQTFFVLLSGAVLGKKWGPASQLGYLGLGLSGLPVFSAAGAGMGYLLGPTGGYLIGFIVSSWIMGRLLEKRAAHNPAQIALFAAASSISGIYLFGVLGLSLFLKCNLAQALALGFFPFIAGDILKVIGISFIFGKIEQRCRRLFS